MADKIKILHLINSLKLGGAEVNLINIIEASDLGRFEVHVGYAETGPLKPRFEHCHVGLYQFAPFAHKVKNPRSVLTIMKLANYIRKHKIDIVHTHSFSAHVWGSAAAKLAGCKVLEHVHDGRYADPEFLRNRGANPDQFKQARYFSRLSDEIIVLTKTNEDNIRENRLCGKAKLGRLLNGIPLSKNGIRRKEDVFSRYPQLKDRKIIFMAARLAEGKNLEMIFELTSSLKSDFPEILFLIAGDGPLMELLKLRAKEAELEKNILFIGFYNPVKELLNICDIVIHPSFMELHSITVIEALSMEKPVLASRHVGCHDEWLSHRDTAFLLDPYQPREWADTIRELFKDQLLAQKVAKNGRRLAEQTCDIRKSVGQLQLIYEQLKGRS